MSSFVYTLKAADTKTIPWKIWILDFLSYEGALEDQARLFHNTS